VTSAADAIEFLSPVGALAAPAGPSMLADDDRPAAAGVTTAGAAAGRRKAPPALDRDLLDLESAQVLDAMPRRGGMGTSRVAQRAGLPPMTAARILGGLAATGFVERCPEGWRLRRA
jgi:hypothetical protein